MGGRVEVVFRGYRLQPVDHPQRFLDRSAFVGEKVLEVSDDFLTKEQRYVYT